MFYAIEVLGSILYWILFSWWFPHTKDLVLASLSIAKGEAVLEAKYNEAIQDNDYVGARQIATALNGLTARRKDIEKHQRVKFDKVWQQLVDESQAEELQRREQRAQQRQQEANALIAIMDRKLSHYEAKIEMESILRQTA